jgi:uncharacterized protein YaiL (DUF2058 family)
MSARRCFQGRQLAISVTHSTTDLVKVARLATRAGIHGERAQRLIPEKKAQIEHDKTILAQHVETCDECATVAAEQVTA